MDLSNCLYFFFLTNSKDHEEQRREEQRKYGVFFDDDYDYLQHLKEASGPSELVPSFCGQQSRIVITSEGRIEDEIQRIAVSSIFADREIQMFLAAGITSRISWHWIMLEWEIIESFPTMKYAVAHQPLVTFCFCVYLF